MLRIFLCDGGHASLCNTLVVMYYMRLLAKVELQWLEHLWNHESMFETGVVRATEC